MRQSSPGRKAWRLIGYSISRAVEEITVSDGNHWKCLLKKGRRAYQRGDYCQAKVHLNLALQIAESFGEKDERLVETLAELAELYQSSGEVGNDVTRKIPIPSLSKISVPTRAIDR